MIKIEEIFYYLPNEPIKNKSIGLKNPSWDMEVLFDKTGVNTRYYANENETALDLSIKACDELFKNRPEIRDSIDGLIFCTQSNDYIMPPNSTILHGVLNLSEDVFAYDFNLACSGFVYGLSMAHGLIHGGIAKNILLINADTYSKYINKKDRSTKVLFGDAASVSYITKSRNKKGIIAFRSSTSGKNHKKFIILAGGARMPKSKETSLVNVDKSGNERTAENIHMDGMGIFAFVNSKVPLQIRTILKQNNLDIDDINLFIFHQASKLALESLTKILKIDKTKVFTNISSVGNTVSASIPIALKDAMYEGKINEGDKVLCSGFGVGLSWSTCIIQY